MSRKLEQKQARREAEERRHKERRRAARKRNLVTFAVAGLVGALVVWLVLQERGANEVGSDFGVAAEEAGCTEVKNQPDEGQEHIDEGSALTFQSIPPSSGKHYPVTADPGFHSEPVAEGNLVHNLEHGQLVIWYSPDAPAGIIGDLETYVDDAGVALVAAPYDQVPDGHNFSISAWGATQDCDEVSGEVLCQFRDRFQGKGPEQVGTPTFDCEEETA
jgi:hypothetical protein